MKNCIICRKEITRNTPGQFESLTCNERCARTYRRVSDYLRRKINFKLDKIRRLLRNNGRSNFIYKSEVEDILKISKNESENFNLL